MLTNNEIKRQMQLGNIIIENIGTESLNKPNSCNLRIGNVLYTYDYKIIDTRDAATYLHEVIYDRPQELKRIVIPETGFLLEPHKVYLVRTVEEVETHGFIPVMHGKTAMSLLGVSTELDSGYKKDNFKGPLLLSIIATKPTIIYPDIKIGNLTFFRSLGPSDTLGKLGNSVLYGAYPEGMLSGAEIQKRMQGENPDILIDRPDNIVINPNSVNLTLNESIGVYEDPVLDLKKKSPIKIFSIKEDGMWLYPDEVYLARTNEWTETQNLVPMMSGRSSLGRNGLHVHCSAGMGSIGYKGFWHLGVRPVKPIWVVKDMKCCQIYFFTTEGEIGELYNGSMQDLSPSELGSQMHRAMSLTYKPGKSENKK